LSIFTYSIVEGRRGEAVMLQSGKKYGKPSATFSNRDRDNDFRSWLRGGREVKRSAVPEM